MRLRVTFNTGRLYTAQGQIITALWDTRARRIHFRDYSRMISGTINAPEPPVEWGTNIPESIARHVMILYDRLEYEMTVESLKIERDPHAIIHEFCL